MMDFFIVTFSIFLFMVFFIIVCMIDVVKAYMSVDNVVGTDESIKRMYKTISTNLKEYYNKEFNEK